MQFDQLKRQEFIGLLGGAATWPLLSFRVRFLRTICLR